MVRPVRPSFLSRRRLLGAAAVAPVGLAVAALAPALRAGTGLLRPPARGTTGAVCATCGAADHSMLDPRCPQRPRLAREGRPGSGAHGSHVPSDVPSDVPSRVPSRVPSHVPSDDPSDGPVHGPRG